MSPNKTLEAQIDSAIENDIRFWQETKDREWLQMELEIDEQEDRANDYD